MTGPDLSPDLDQLGAALRAAATADLAQQPAAVTADAPATRSRLRRPRVLAGGSLGLAGAAAAAVFAFGGAAATSPAFAITKKADGSVLVTFNFIGQQTYAAADAKLRSEYDETFLVKWAPGPATTSGPVTCTPSTTIDQGAPTPVRVLLGDDGTATIPAGDTGAGTVHITNCTLYNDDVPSNTGNTGS